ncbi:AAA family ATPase [Flavobacterium sp. RSB2_4_14]|uniref:AAA family ATPase n=1 Tax=Flavobacterium sp. RSB2_4_14 TaxID=3447665 RepID=UPI003F3BAD61
MEEAEKNSEKGNLSLQNNSFEIYDRSGNYINMLRMYHAYYNQICNIKSIDNIDEFRMRSWFTSEMKESIIREHYDQSYSNMNKRNLYSDHFFFMNNGIVINLYNNCVSIIFEPSLENEAQKLQNQLLQFRIKKRRRTTKISLIVNSSMGLITKDIDLKKPKLNLNLHYNDDFKEIHHSILKNIKKQKSKGLYLFHGQPGTGKSTYIKHLIHQQSKQVIFLSPKLASNLDDLGLTEFLLDNPNCILVIEDAEDLILSRDNHHNSKLSFLLNLTDGLLGESLGIQIIATFNTDLKNIDKALLRKGRLTSIYEFKTLTVDKTNILLKNLGHEVEINESLPLAEIFNFEISNNYEPKLRKAVGFGN